MTTMSHKVKLPCHSHDRVFLEKKLKNNNSEEAKCVDTNVELTFDVLTIIFKNLNARDLCAAAMVCRSWNDAAENERRVRGNAAVALLTDMGDSWMDTNRLIEQLRTKPMLGFMFTRPFDHRHPAAKTNNDECPCRLLPSKCPSILVGNYGVVKDGTEFEENPKKVASMLLPHDKDVTIRTIGLPMTADEGISLSRHERIAKKMLKKLAVAKNKTKCFILLIDEDFDGASDILSYMPRDEERSVSGGVACQLALCKRNKDGEMCARPMAWIGILISGPSVRSWSVVLKKSCDNSDKIRAKLQLLRSQIQLKKHSVGFMFACQGRGEYMFKGKNVEASAFKAVFPEVPLVGGFGGGEYGDSSVGPSDRCIYYFRASERTNASIFHHIYDRLLRLIVNLALTCIWRLFGVSKHEAKFYSSSLTTILPSLTIFPRLTNKYE